MYKVGDFLVGSDCYNWTSKNTLLVVTELRPDAYDDIRVTIIAGYDEEQLNSSWEINSKCSTPITVEKYFNKYPDAKKCDNFDSIIESLTISKSNEKIKFDNNFVLTDEEMNSLIKETKTLLEQYHYPVTTGGIRNILKEWANNKGSLISIMKNHPNYNGKYQIAFDTDYERTIDKNAICKFKKYILSVYSEMINTKISCMTYEEAYEIKENIDYVICYMRNIKNIIKNNNVMVNGNNIDHYEKESTKFATLIDLFENEIRNGNKVKYIVINKTIIITKNERDIMDKLIDAMDFVYYNDSQFLTKETASEINNSFPSVKAVSGQKISRVVNKICRMLGIDKDKDYNKEFANFSDAVNPLNIVRHTVLSCHPIDYLTMSFGNSWASCHTIDKQNERGMENSYHGQYSGGTLSYMLDKTSMVFYTVDNKYSGNELELQPKINRNMFHFGNDKLIQGRVYPQTNDDEKGIYMQIRNIVQKIMSDCLHVDNLWLLKRGTKECGNVTDSLGVHFKDYLSFSSCNVSYLKRNDSINELDIIIGHEGICPRCGCVHKHESNILCNNCTDIYERTIENIGIENNDF